MCKTLFLFSRKSSQIFSIRCLHKLIEQNNPNLWAFKTIIYISDVKNEALAINTA